jgi:hypothetical protein
MSAAGKKTNHTRMTRIACSLPDGCSLLPDRVMQLKTSAWANACELDLAPLAKARQHRQNTHGTDDADDERWDVDASVLAHEERSSYHQGAEDESSNDQRPHPRGCAIRRVVGRSRFGHSRDFTS